MDHFVNKSEDDKKAYFALTADKKKLPEQIIEKDFWVCWTLKQLFSLSNIGENLIFKGGTSLSKAYHLIERFSEDIDIPIDKSYFSFTGDQDPENARNVSNKTNADERTQACYQHAVIKHLSNSSMTNTSLRERF